MSYLKFMSGVALCAGIALPCAAASGTAAITTQQIASAITAAGMTVSSDQVTLLSDVVADAKEPALRVGPMQLWGEHQMKVRMECIHRDCVPFFVAVHWNGPGSAKAAASLPSVHAEPDAAPVVMRAGAAVTLLLEGEHIRIQLPVVCLESGRAGQTIRVSSKDHRQLYTARIVDSNHLRGVLE